MTTEPDANELNRLLDALIERADRLDGRLQDDKNERVRENEKRDKRIRWSKFAIAASMLVAVIALLVGNEARATANDIVAARAQGRAAVCNGFESFTNSLIASSTPAKTAEEQVAQQQKIDMFKADLEKRLGPLDCQLHLIEAPSQAGG